VIVTGAAARAAVETSAGVGAAVAAESVVAGAASTGVRLSATAVTAADGAADFGDRAMAVFGSFATAGFWSDDRTARAATVAWGRSMGSPGPATNAVADTGSGAGLTAAGCGITVSSPAAGAEGRAGNPSAAIASNAAAATASAAPRQRVGRRDGAGLFGEAAAITSGSGATGNSGITDDSCIMTGGSLTTGGSRCGAEARTFTAAVRVRVRRFGVLFARAGFSVPTSAETSNVHRTRRPFRIDGILIACFDTATL
jgi:hypothetical protein